MIGVGGDLGWVRDEGGPGKETTLEAAIAREVEPGMAIYLPTDAQAAVRALVRRFWGTRPALTIIALRAGASHVGELLFAGAVKRLVGASFGVQFPSFRPSALIQRAYAEGGVEFECWSLYSLVQRLMAAGLGLPFLPTNQLAGSTMAEVNDAYRQVPHPVTGAKVPVVMALHPDVTFVHALAADPLGNAIVAPPFEDDLWSTRAARKGIIVLAENVVSTDFVRQRAQLVKVPGYRVLAVCHTPFAAHPEGFESGLDLGLDLQRYARDEPHYRQYFEASKDPERFRDWIERWVLAPGSHASYLEALGPRYRERLCPAGGPAADWRAAYRTIPASASPEWNAVEMMVTATARTLADVIRARGARSLLVGAGTAELAGGLALYLLRRFGCRIDLVQGVGRFGFEPVPVPGFRQLTATMLTSTVEAYGAIVGGHDNRGVALLGAGEIDVRGNINSTLSGGRLVVGSGGGNDAVSGAAETVVMMRQHPRRMVQAVEYVTSPGAKVGHLVTDEGIFRKGPDGRFRLWRYYPSAPAESTGAALARVQATCGWPVEPAPDLKADDPPTSEELRLVRWLDSASDG